MGEASRRGTREQRVAQAIARREEEARLTRERLQREESHRQLLVREKVAEVNRRRILVTSGIGGYQGGALGMAIAVALASTSLPVLVVDDSAVFRRRK